MTCGSTHAGIFTSARSSSPQGATAAWSHRPATPFRNSSSRARDNAATRTVALSSEDFVTSLPLLPATVIGSWSFPGWYAKFCEDAARQPELFGPEDRDEAVRDAVRLAVDDQLRAGADLI